MRILLLYLLIISCTYNEYDCPTEVSYEQNIKEIIDDNCIVCHESYNYNQVLDNIENIIYRIDLDTLDSKIMPPKWAGYDKLTDEEINQIKLWNECK